MAIALLVWIAWIGYLMTCKNPKWENHLILFAFISAGIIYGVAESFWPVISVQENQFVVHRALWAPTRIGLQDVRQVSGDAAVLYLTMKTGKIITINLQKLSEADRTSVRNAASDFIDRQ